MVKEDMLGFSQQARKNYIASLREDMGRAVEECHYTPDGAFLNRHFYHDVFVYGTLKLGFPMHSLLNQKGETKPVFLGYGRTATSALRMWKIESQRSFPVILPDKTTEGGFIQGEVWRVPTKVMFKLDFFESNGIMYERRKMPIRITTGYKKWLYHPSWIYVGIKDYWKGAKEGKSTLRKLVPCEPSIFLKDDGAHHYTFKKADAEDNTLH